MRQWQPIKDFAFNSHQNIAFDIWIKPFMFLELCNLERKHSLRAQATYSYHVLALFTTYNKSEIMQIIFTVQFLWYNNLFFHYFHNWFLLWIVYHSAAKGKLCKVKDLPNNMLLINFHFVNHFVNGLYYIEKYVQFNALLV